MAGKSFGSQLFQGVTVFVFTFPSDGKQRRRLVVFKLPYGVQLSFSSSFSYEVIFVSDLVKYFIK